LAVERLKKWRRHLRACLLSSKRLPPTDRYVEEERINILACAELRALFEHRGTRGESTPLLATHDMKNP
jgi:hypothetical protein